MSENKVQRMPGDQVKALFSEHMELLETGLAAIEQGKAQTKLAEQGLAKLAETPGSQDVTMPGGGEDADNVQMVCKGIVTSRKEWLGKGRKAMNAWKTLKVVAA